MEISCEFPPTRKQKDLGCLSHFLLRSWRTRFAQPTAWRMAAELRRHAAGLGQQRRRSIGLKMLSEAIARTGMVRLRNVLMPTPLCADIVVVRTCQGCCQGLIKFAMSTPMTRSATSPPSPVRPGPRQSRDAVRLEASGTAALLLGQRGTAWYTAVHDEDYPAGVP